MTQIFRSTPRQFAKLLTKLTVFALWLVTLNAAHAGDIDASGFSLYSGGTFYVLSDGVFGTDETIQVRFEAGGNTALKEYGGVDVRLYRVPKPLEFLKAQKNLHRPAVAGKYFGEGLSNVLSYVWDSCYKKARLAWQRVFSPDARKSAVAAAPDLRRPPAHTYKTAFTKEPQFQPLAGYELVDSIRYPLWKAQPNEPPKDTKLAGSSSNFIQTPAGNVILPLGKRKPGLYLVEAMIGSFRATTLVFVSNTIAVTKVSSQQALVWTVNRATGMSSPKSRIVLTDGVGTLDQGAAGDDGVYVTKRSMPERSFAIVEDREGGVAVSENFFFDSEVYQSKIYLFSDRPLYQPGETVIVRAFGRNIERSGAKDVWSALPGQKGELTVVDSSGVVLFTKDMPWRGAEGGEVSFRLPESAESGGYSLKLNFGGEDYGAAIRVARFTKPHFDAQIQFDQPGYKVGEVVKGRVILSYPSGQPVVGADIDLQLRSEQMSMFEGSYGYGAALPVELSQKSYKSDARGQIQFSFPAAAKPSRYIASARVMDQAAFRVSTKKELLIEGYLETYILTSELNATAAGAPVKFTYTRQASDAADLSQAVKNWQAIRLEDRSVSFGPVTSVDRGEFTAKLEKPGHYMVRVVDASGVTRGVRSHVVLGPGLKSTTGQVEILADRDGYAIGETAKIILTFPSATEDALLTLERNDVSAYGRLGVKGGSWYSAKKLTETQWQVDVVIKDTHAPNIIFSVASAKNGDFGFQNKGLAVKKPMIEIAFKPEKAIYSPGEKVVVNVETKLGGKPFSALIAVGVVDEMIYVLQPEIAPPIGEFFHYQRRNQVRTTSSLSFYSFNPGVSDVVSASPATAGRDLKMQDRAGRDARSTAYWNGSLKTDASGRARFEFVMPDALTRWRITGRALAVAGPGLSEGAVGDAKGFLLSNQEFFLKWTGPTRFRKGDKPRPALIAFNSTAKPVNAQVTLAGPNYNFSQKILMQPGATSLSLDKAPEQSLAFQSKLIVDGKTVDLLSSQVVFAPENWMQKQSQIVRLEKGAAAKLPAGASGVRLKLMSESAFQFQRIADDLMEYPWGCVEQTSSRLIAMTMAVTALESGSEVNIALRDQIAADRRRLVGMAGKNAEFSWWGDQTGGDLLITAHAYHADWRASRFLGIQIPAENWDHLHKVYAGAKSASLSDRAYALWVLSFIGQPTKEQAQSLANELPAMSAEKPSKTQSVWTSDVMDTGESGQGTGQGTAQRLAVLILGNLFSKNGLAVSPTLKAHLDAALRAPSGSASGENSVLLRSAILAYRARTKQPGDRVSEAASLLESVRYETPTIDRAMTLAWIEEALPQASQLKAIAKSGKGVDLGAEWVRESVSTLPVYKWKDQKNLKASLSLPTLPGALAEVVYESPEAPKSTMGISVTRRLYRVNLAGANAEAEEGDGRLMSVIEVKPAEPLDSRALYLDEVIVTPNQSETAKAQTARFMLLEVPLPPGGDVEGTTWGLEFAQFKTNFSEARSASSSMGYAVPIESLKGETTFHQLVRFSSRGQFRVPPVKLFRMYRPMDRAFEAETSARAITVN